MSADCYSLSSVKLNEFCCGRPLASATGFFGRRKGRIFLISNWHVFSGRDPRNGRARENGAIPDKIEFQFATTTKISDNGIWQVRKTEKQTLTINGESSGWEQHQLGQSIDLAVVQMPFDLSHCHSVDLDDEDARKLEHAPRLAVTQDVYIVGFPGGLAHADMLQFGREAQSRANLKFL